MKTRKPSPEDLALAELEVQSAYSALQAAQYTAGYEAQVAQAKSAEREATIKAHETEVAHLEANLSRLETRLQQMRLVAPFAGTVVALSARAGDKVEPAQSLGILADTAEVGLEVTVSEAQLPEFAVGKEAQVVIDGFAAQKLVAKVARLPDKPAQEQSARTYAVRLAFAEGTKLPGPVGTGADVYLASAKKQVLVLPKGAVSQEGDRSFVAVPSGSGTRLVAVVVGVASATEMEIVSGLQEGAEVLLIEPTASTK